VGWYPAGHEKPHALKLVPQSGSHRRALLLVHPVPHEKSQYRRVAWRSAGQLKPHRLSPVQPQPVQASGPGQVQELVQVWSWQLL
jgi:hypothetical protein